MNSSVAPTEMLKLEISPSFSLQWMKSRTSGWETLRTAMLAPRRTPPWAITPKEESYAFKKPTGPVERPPERFTKSPRGRRRENPPRLPPQVILDGQDETGRQLSQGSSRSRPSWRIGYEEEIGQKFEENFRNFSRIIPELLLGHCDPGRDPPD